MADPENFGGGDLKHKTSKIRMSSPKLRVIFRPKSEIQPFFSPMFRWSPKKKKKVFTKIESDFSAEIGVGGMHPEMEPNYSKQRLIFRPKSLLLGWWGGCIPPSPPPKSATGLGPRAQMRLFLVFTCIWLKNIAKISKCQGPTQCKSDSGNNMVCRHNYLLNIFK